jgi:hypothetical protein
LRNTVLFPVQGGLGPGALRPLSFAASPRYSASRPRRARGESVERCRARLTLAQGDIRLRQGRYRSATALLDQAAASAQRLGDQASLAHVYTLLYWAHADMGSDERLRFSDRNLLFVDQRFTSDPGRPVSSQNRSTAEIAGRCSSPTVDRTGIRLGCRLRWVLALGVRRRVRGKD